MTEERRVGLPLEEILEAKRRLEDESRPDAVTQQHERGKMTARERVDFLLDEGSEVEYGALLTPDANERLDALDVPRDGIIAAVGTIDGRPVTLLANDFTVLGGSNGNAGVAKIIRMARISLEQGIPHVVLLDGGGHRMQEMDPREFATGGPSAFREQALMSGWVPQVAALMGPAFAGPAAQAMFADFVPMVKGTASVGIAGRVLVKGATGEEISTEELGGAARQARNGASDLTCDDDKACLEAIREFLSYLPSNASVAPPIQGTEDDADREIVELRDAIPTSRRRAYDVKRVLRMVIDDGHLMELRPEYARNVVVGLARMAGRPVGIVANQPTVLAGALDTPACLKIARFVAMCDAYGLPLITFIDSPGMLVGSGAEAQGLARYATKVLMVLGHTSVPIVSVVLRKAYGLAYLALAGGRSWGAAASFLLPTAEVCPMGIEGAVDQAYRREYESAEDPEARRTELIERLYSMATPLRAASGFGVDDVIDPASLRRKINLVLDVNRSRRPLGIPPKRTRIDPA